MAAPQSSSPSSTETTPPIPTETHPNQYPSPASLSSFA